MPTLLNPAASAQAAMHRAQLLLARCRADCGRPDTTTIETAPAHEENPEHPEHLRAHWHAQQQEHFLAWLEAGGFAQGTIENSGIAPLFSAPSRGMDEECKFSLVRIDDAV